MTLAEKVLSLLEAKSVYLSGSGRGVAFPKHQKPSDVSDGDWKQIEAAFNKQLQADIDKNYGGSEEDFDDMHQDDGVFIIIASKKEGVGLDAAKKKAGIVGWITPPVELSDGSFAAVGIEGV